MIFLCFYKLPLSMEYFRKIVLYFILLFVLASSSFSQRGYWGTTINFHETALQSTGKLFRTDSIGSNLVVMHHFSDILFGRSPNNSLLLASNGKIYGTTVGGGTYNWGTLFEYDLAIDSFKVLVNFGPGIQTDRPHDGLIETSPGILYGVGGSPIGKIFKYNISSNTFSLVASVPNFPSGTQTIQNPISGGLYKASNGLLYGTTTLYSACSFGTPNVGSVFRFNPTNNSFSYIYPFNCSYVSGASPNGNFVEYNGKLYSTTSSGGTYYNTQTGGKGVIFEYNPVANTYTKKFDFNDTLGAQPSQQSLVKAANGKLYGLTMTGGNSIHYGSNGNLTGGVLYEYNPLTNVVTKKYDFKVFLNQSGLYVGSNPTGNLLLASNGKLYGSTTFGGVFEYDPIADTVIQRHSNLLTGDFSPNGHLIEICRKPAYKYFANATYTICSGSFFQFDLHCDNANSIIWKKNGIAVPSQTNSILYFNSISLTDAGVWTCELSNECGITIPTGSLTIAVNTAPVGTITSTLSPSGTTFICPGSTVTLSGNSGGAWNTGSTASSITISALGDYQVINTNACGNTYSNIVRIDTIPRPIKPIITAPPMLCPYDSIIITTNISGVWSIGGNQDSVKVFPQLNTPYFLVNAHQCGSDTSNIIQYSVSSYYFVGDSAKITPVGSLRLCLGDSVYLNSNFNSLPSNNPEQWTWYFPYAGIPFGMAQNISNDPGYYAKEPGKYLLIKYDNCKITTDTVEVLVDSFPPVNPIVTALSNTALCGNDSLRLSSNVLDNVWNTGDTIQHIMVHQAGSYFTTTQNGCGSSISNTVTVSVNPIPPAAIIAASDTNYICIGNSITLSSNMPMGNVWGIGGDTAQSISVSNSGTFIVMQFQNGCYSLPSNSVVVIVQTCTDIIDLERRRAIIYPNPNHGEFIISILQKGVYKIINTLGQTIEVIDFRNEIQEIQITNLSPGIYYLVGENFSTKIAISR